MISRDLRVVPAKVNNRLVEDFNLPSYQVELYERGIGTAVIVLILVNGFGIVRTLVAGIGHTIAIIVWFRATVVVFESIEVFRLVRTLIVGIRNVVRVVVFWTTVVVFKLIHVLGLVRTTIVRIGQPVFVVVAIGTAIFVGKAITILRFIGAGIIGVHNGVAVLVSFTGIWLRIGFWGLFLVDNPFATCGVCAIERPAPPTQAEECPIPGCTHPRKHPSPCAAQYRQALHRLPGYGHDPL